MQSEVPIFRQLGYEVFIPKVIPTDDPGYRSGAVTYEFDEMLALAPSALRVLNTHDFYRRRWSPTIERILNEEFDVVVTSISAYLAPVLESVRAFSGTVVARVFGREHPRRYTEFFLDSRYGPFLSLIPAMGDRFVFGQAFDNLADVEDPVLRARAHTITPPLPPFVYERAGTWHGGGEHAILLCPGIAESPYYGAQYDEIKRCFGGLPHRIFGRQLTPVEDPTVLGYLSDDALLDLYATAPVFLYPSTEPRHVHYSPLEAMVVGTPVLYRRDALIDTLMSGADMPGACDDAAEMEAKARALLAGDRDVADAIRATQDAVVRKFSSEVAHAQWAQILAPIGAVA
ncbi:MAG TPA: hypothetical protein VIB48_04795 [Acidimicrobiia bacterium]|jgi:hypothetical protein